MTRASLGSICAAIPTTGPHGRAADARRPSLDGGCEVLEDPELDGRAAHPQWLSSPDGLLQVRAAHARSVGALRFDLWRIPGRKRLVFDGRDLALTAEVSARRMRLSLSGDLADGAACASTVPLTPRLRGELDLYRAQAQALAGHAPRPSPARPTTRAALLHLRALQVLDASLAGASHRDIARALFGLETVVLRWHEDSELRAQVRHLLRRAEEYMRGGYLTLAGVLPGSEQAGDEPVR